MTSGSWTISQTASASASVKGRRTAFSPARTGFVEKSLIGRLCPT
ncbi:hypothetical protein ACWCQ1_01485 [Streptomyces sp. NPDC002144]